MCVSVWVFWVIVHQLMSFWFCIFQSHSIGSYFSTLKMWQVTVVHHVLGLHYILVPLLLLYCGHICLDVFSATSSLRSVIGCIRKVFHFLRIPWIATIIFMYFKARYGWNRLVCTKCCPYHFQRQKCLFIPILNSHIAVMERDETWWIVQTVIMVLF